MFNAVTPIIGSFPNDDCLWRLEWLGGLTRNGEAREPLVRILFCSFGKDCERSEQVRRWCSVGIGSLPLLHIGSLWYKGELVGTLNSDWVKEDLNNITIFPERMQSIAAGHSFEARKFLIPPYLHKTTFEGMDTRCLAIRNAFDEFSVVIPMMEVIRYYYAKTTKLTHFILHHGIGDHAGRLLNPLESDLDSNPPIVQLRKDVENEAAPFIARIAIDPIALLNAKRILSSIRRVAPVERTIHPEAFPPFIGKTSLRASGIWLNNEKTRFLVLRILECSHPFPFEGLQWRRDTDKGAEQLGGDIQVIPVRDPATTPPSPLPGKKIEKGVDPSFNYLAVKFPIDIDKFPDLDVKLINRVEKEKPSTPATSYLPGGSNEYDGFSTGDETYSDTGHAKANVVSKNDPPDGLQIKVSIPVRFIALKEALDLLGDEENVVIKYYQLNVDLAIELDEWVSFFPQSNNGQKLSFSYLKNGTRRRVLVACVSINCKFFYIFEIERDDLKLFEKFSTRIIYTKLCEKIEFVGIYEILAETAENKKWSDLNCNSIRSSIQMIRMNHTTNQPIKISARIRGKLLMIVESEFNP